MLTYAAVVWSSRVSLITVRVDLGRLQRLVCVITEPPSTALTASAASLNGGD
jgi:hypothetical protein